MLTYFRRRLRSSERPERIFDAVRAVVRQTGVLGGRDRRALDLTVLEDAVATQDTVTQLTSAIRRVRRTLPAVREVELSAHDYDQATKPACDWSDPEARDQLVTGLVSDALVLLDAAAGGELSPDAEEAVGLLGLVAGQDVEPGDEEGTWRIARRVAPDRVISTVDPETRHTRKSPSQRNDGYKAHVAVEPETGLVTACDLTPANVADGPTGVDLLAEENPMEVIADSAYGSGSTRAALAGAGHRGVIKPPPLRPAVPGGFTVDDFAIDLTARTATCPAGHTVPISPSGTARFRSRCEGCPLRECCTTAATGRDVNVHPHYDLLAQARRQAQDPAFQETYRRYRPLVERSLAWLVRGNRRLRYRGVDRNRQWLHHRAAAINLNRLLTLGLERGTQSWALAPSG